MKRNLNDQHAVRIISMDNSGNLAFAVYGYMNRGEHEGEVGVGIYYFDVERNLIQEKAFIPSKKSMQSQRMSLARWFIIIMRKSSYMFWQTELCIR